MRGEGEVAGMTSAAEKKLLLLVDDDSENIQVVHSILKDRYKLRVATNGAKALELAKVEPLPDLILLDVMMPPIVTARVRNHLMLRDAHETVARQLVAINSELEMARQIQLSILPRQTPQLPGLAIEARYLPMSSVAGDFYDFLELDEQHLGLLIADVSGPGLPSPLIASM